MSVENLVFLSPVVVVVVAKRREWRTGAAQSLVCWSTRGSYRWWQCPYIAQVVGSQPNTLQTTLPIAGCDYLDSVLAIEVAHRGEVGLSLSKHQATSSLRSKNESIVACTSGFLVSYDFRSWYASDSIVHPGLDGWSGENFRPLLRKHFASSTPAHL